MPTPQGSLDLLIDPVAQDLLQSHIPARLDYNWTDGTPRVVPIGFHWTGEELALGTFLDAPKMRALEDGVKVAVSIDSDTMPYKVLLIRGAVRTNIVEGIAAEYAAMTRRVMGDEQAGPWLDTMRPLTPQMAVIYIRPEWVGILDFEARFPSALERAIEHTQPQA